jgi:hypothetical protein
MTDVQVKQARDYQRQQIRLMQAEMFREDIRDLVGASVSKLGNYVIIATLVLGMIAECYVEGPLPDGTAEFVRSVYSLCVSSSLLYVIMAVLCAVRANELATQCQKELLTTLVRLPVEEFVADIDEAAAHESVEAFEHQSLGTMLRLPGVSRFRRTPAMGTAPSSGQGVPPLVDLLPSPDAEELGTVCAANEGKPNEVSTKRATFDRFDCRPKRSLARRFSDVPSGLHATADRQAEEHLHIYHGKERTWLNLQRHAYHFGVSGMIQFLQAYGYFSAARYYSGYKWSCWIVQVTLVLVAMGIAMHALDLLAIGERIVGATVIVGAPAACATAMISALEWADRICIPLCISCHLLWEGLLWYKTLGIADAGPDASSEFARQMETCPRPGRWKRQERQGKVYEHRSIGHNEQGRRTLCPIRMGSSVVILAWFMTLAWALWTGCSADDGTRAPKPRHLRGESFSSAGPSATVMAMPLVTQGVPVAWISRHFRPRALSCSYSASHGSSCFVANQHVLFELRGVRTLAGNISGGATPSGSLAHWGVSGEILKLDHSPCNFSGVVDDVLLLTDAHGVGRPVVLTSGAKTSDQVVPSTLSDCSTGASQALLPALSRVHRLTVTSNNSLLTLHGGEILLSKPTTTQAYPELASDPPSKVGLAWTPWWPVAQVGAGRVAGDGSAGRSSRASVVGMSALGDSKAFLFYGDGALDMIDLDDGRVASKWTLQLPAREKAPMEVLSGAVVEEGSSLLILARIGDERTGSGSTKLLRAELPVPAATAREGGGNAHLRSG